MQAKIKIYFTDFYFCIFRYQENKTYFRTIESFLKIILFIINSSFYQLQLFFLVLFLYMFDQSKKFVSTDISAQFEIETNSSRSQIYLSTANPLRSFRFKTIFCKNRFLCLLDGLQCVTCHLVCMAVGHTVKSVKMARKIDRNFPTKLNEQLVIHTIFLRKLNFTLALLSFSAMLKQFNMSKWPTQDAYESRC